MGGFTLMFSVGTRQREKEGAALPYLADDANLPAEFFDDAPDDRQSQSVPLRAYLIEPRELSEQVGLRFGWNAGTVIAQPETHQAIGLGLGA